MRPVDRDNSSTSPGVCTAPEGSAEWLEAHDDDGEWAREEAYEQAALHIFLDEISVGEYIQRMTKVLGDEHD